MRRWRRYIRGKCCKVTEKNQLLAGESFFKGNISIFPLLDTRTHTHSHPNTHTVTPNTHTVTPNTHTHTHTHTHTQSPTHTHTLLSVSHQPEKCGLMRHHPGLRQLHLHRQPLQRRRGRGGGGGNETPSTGNFKGGSMEECSN